MGSSGSGGAAGKAGAGTGGAGPAGTGGAPLDPDGGKGGGGGQQAGSAGGPAGGRGAAGNAAACGPSESAPPAPLRALTRFEYNNSVRDLFTDNSRPADALPADGATNVVADAPFRPETVDGLHRLAHDFALSATKDAAAASALIGCDAAPSGQTACQAKLLGDLLPRILRRPLTAEDQTEFAEVFATGQRLGGTFASGVRAVVEVALQSPEFQYRVEFGEPIAGAAVPGLARPSPYEMAARLSFLLWGSTPDPALLAAAAAGKLRTSDEIATEARRLLADPRAHDVVRYFTFQLMRLHDTDYSGLATATPAFASLAPLLLEETGRFVDEVTWTGKGDFSALLTSPVSYVNGPLASFYGITGVSSDDFVRVSLDPARRAGLLTQPSVLARMSSGTSNNPSGRGLLVLKGLLCSQLPEPPIDEVPLRASPGTTRARTETATAGAACQVCHKPLDSAGFAFEHFDAVGRWRDLEADQPIDAHGELIDTDARGRFDGAVELARRLADSQDARACYVEKWMAFAYGRTASPADACTRSQLLEAFAGTGGNIPELLFALTRTEAFLTRPPSQP